MNPLLIFTFTITIFQGETISRLTDIPQRRCTVSDDSPCGHINAAMGRPKRCTLQQEGGGDHLITHPACAQKCQDWNNSDLRNRLGGRLPCVAVESNAAEFPGVGICTLIKARGFPELEPDCPVMFDVEPSSNKAYSASDICKIRRPSVQGFHCHRVFPSGGNEDCPVAVFCA